MTHQRRFCNEWFISTCFWVGVLWLWIGGNVALYHVFHERVHQQGLNLISEVADAGLDPLIEQDRREITRLAEAQGFELSNASNAASDLQRESQQWFYSQPENEVFTAKGVTLILRHTNTVVFYAHWFVSFSGLLLIVAAFAFRWLKVWRKQFIVSASLQQSEFVEPVNSKSERVTEPVNLLLAEQYGLFSLVSYEPSLPNECDAEAYFKVVIAKALPKSQKCRVKYLNTGLLAITFPLVNQTDMHDMTAIVHEQIYRALRKYRSDLSRKAVKVGACFYPHQAEQAKVYQLSKSSLAIASSNLWHHYHCQPLNHTQNELFSEKRNVMEYLEKGRFMILFQPLISFELQDIMASEALLRVRHEKIGLMSAKQFIQHLSEPSQYIELDKAVLTHIIKVLQKEPSSLDVHINLHSVSWQNEPFQKWLLEKLGTFKDSSRLVFEIAASDYAESPQKYHAVFRHLFKKGSRVIVDHVEKPIEMSQFVGQTAIVGLKLSVDTLLNIEVDLQKQRVVREIVTQAKLLKLIVFAVGVENHQTLLCLQKLGIKGAQGHYFSEPLQQFSDSGMISGHGT
ncbi:protein with EAL domain [Pseudoalteromonas luteoviolacea B = ATCC 29581]|nr:protein with EAL domain [Pseudoalteromonas luteoviolacea B = ATCC 29581]